MTISTSTMSGQAADRRPGFRLGIYIFNDAEIIDFPAPYGIFSIARRYDPEIDVFLIADAPRPVQTQAGFTVPAHLQLHRSAGHGRLLDPGRLRHTPGDVQPPAARVHR